MARPDPTDDEARAMQPIEDAVEGEADAIGGDYDGWETRVVK